MKQLEIFDEFLFAFRWPQRCFN